MDLSQREVDLTDLSQREVDLTDILGADEEPMIMQAKISHTPDWMEAFIKRAESSRSADTDAPQSGIAQVRDEGAIPGGRPVLTPRSFGPPRILFPPSQPSPSNVHAICLHSAQRPRYPSSMLPRSGFGHLSRQADVVNRVEARYAWCCQTQGTNQGHNVTLCCARQAWEQTLIQFCENEFSIKTRHYHCCKKEGQAAQFRCFQQEGVNSDYQPITQNPETVTASKKGFKFNPNTCQRSRPIRPEPGPRAVRGKKKKKPLPPTTRDADISFPPGRPTATNIQSICSFRKLRPLYLTKCLPRKGYGWLVRQSKAVNRVERAFKQCCKGKQEGQQEVLSCAEGKWSELLDRFCVEEEGKSPRFSCCELAPGEERYDCFSSRSPHPDYGPKLHSSPSSAFPTNTQDTTLGQICETHKIIKKKFDVGFSVKKIVRECCPLPADQKTTCVEEKLVAVSEDLCKGQVLASDVHSCCSSSPSQNPLTCVSNQLLEAITMATTSPRVRKRKCPLS